MPDAAIGFLARFERKMGRQRAEFVKIVRTRYERISIFGIPAGKSAREISDVGTNAEVAEAPRVHGDVQWGALQRHRDLWLPTAGRSGEFPGIEGKTGRKRVDAGANLRLDVFAGDIFEHPGDQSSHFTHLSLAEAPRGDGRTTEAHPAGIQRRIGVEGNCVFIRGNISVVQG